MRFIGIPFSSDGTRINWTTAMLSLGAQGTCRGAGPSPGGFPGDWALDLRSPEALTKALAGCVSWTGHSCRLDAFGIIMYHPQRPVSTPWILLL